MELLGLIAQRTLVLPLLAGAHATLSAGQSMGQLLTFESTVAPIAAELRAAIKARRVSRTLQRVLPTLSEATGLIAAEEMAEVVDHAAQTLRESPIDAAFDGTAMAQAVLVVHALERARLACGVALDLCEALGVAPNGKPLRAPTTPMPTPDTTGFFGATV